MFSSFAYKDFEHVLIMFLKESTKQCQTVEVELIYDKF